jgi:hypothetical protein
MQRWPTTSYHDTNPDGHAEGGKQINVIRPFPNNPG